MHKETHLKYFTFFLLGLLLLLDFLLSECQTLWCTIFFLANVTEKSLCCLHRDTTDRYYT